MCIVVQTVVAHVNAHRIAYVRMHVAVPKVSQLMGGQLKYMCRQMTPAGTQVAKPQASLQAYSVVVSFWSPDTMVGGFEQTICPPLQAIANVDSDAPLNGVDGGPVLRCRHCIPGSVSL